MKIYQRETEFSKEVFIARDYSEENFLLGTYLTFDKIADVLKIVEPARLWYKEQLREWEELK